MKTTPPMSEETIAAYLDGELNPEDRAAFERLLQQHPEWRAEVAAQAEMIAAFRPLKIKPPRAQVWDGYWEQIDDRLQRRTGQGFLYVGGALLALAGAVIIVASTPNPALQLGEILLFTGMFILFALVLRGRMREAPKDRYRKIRK